MFGVFLAYEPVGVANEELLSEGEQRALALVSIFSAGGRRQCQERDRD